MPVSASRSARFDKAIARLGSLAPEAQNYIRHHRHRCIDDALRLADLRPGGKILNVGGKPYLFEYVARELALDVETLDLAPERNPAEIADLGIDVFPVDIEDPVSRSAIDLGRYDIVCMAEIFEHLRIDLPGTLRFLSAGLRPDALVYLTTPNFYFAPAFLRMLAQGRSGPSLVREWRKLSEGGHMGHVREYAAGELTEFFAFTGLEVASLVVRNSQPIDILTGGLLQAPFRLFAKVLANTFDRFGQELVFVLRPAGSD